MISNSVNPVILLVEDDPLLGMTMRRYLEQWSSDVRCAETGAQAEEIWSSMPLSGIVLMDYRLPDARGTDVIARMRKRGHAETVICMTAESEVITPEQREALAIQHVLDKPVILETLREALNALDIQAPVKGNHTHERAPRSIGRYRHIRLRGAVNETRIARLVKAASDEVWIALDLSDAGRPDNNAWSALCAWAGWLSSSGGRLYLVDQNPNRRRQIEDRAGAYVDVLDDVSRLRAQSARLTGEAERRQLLNMRLSSDKKEAADV